MHKRHPKQHVSKESRSNIQLSSKDGLKKIYEPIKRKNRINAHTVIRDKYIQIGLTIFKVIQNPAKELLQAVPVIRSSVTREMTCAGIAWLLKSFLMITGEFSGRIGTLLYVIG